MGLCVVDELTYRNSVKVVSRMEEEAHPGYQEEFSKQKLRRIIEKLNEMGMAEMGEMEMG